MDAGFLLWMLDSFYGCWSCTCSSAHRAAQRWSNSNGVTFTTRPNRAKKSHRASTRPTMWFGKIYSVSGRGKTKDESKSASVKKGGHILGKRCQVRNNPVELYGTSGKRIERGGGPNSRDESMTPMLPSPKLKFLNCFLTWYSKNLARRGPRLKRWISGNDRVLHWHAQQLHVRLV
jgi:hypothetical protein